MLGLLFQSAELTDGIKNRQTQYYYIQFVMVKSKGKNHTSN